MLRRRSEQTENFGGKLKCYLTGRRFRSTDTSCPVLFRLPALPVELIVTSSSNSPPIPADGCPDRLTPYMLLSEKL